MKKVTGEQKEEREVLFWNTFTASKRKSILKKMVVILEAGYTLEDALALFIHTIQIRKGKIK
jgi:hypothetical protein